MEVTDSNTYRDEETMAKSVTAEVAIESLKKMQERLEVDTEENIDPQLLTEVSSRVIGSLRRRISTKENAEEMRKVENLERRFRLTALRAERGELYHLRATQKSVMRPCRSCCTIWICWKHCWWRRANTWGVLSMWARRCRVAPI